MAIPVLSTAYFPNTDYCKVFCNNSKVLIDIGEHFVKQSQRSRCEILGPNGILKLIVPLKKRKNRMPTKDVRIAYDENWQKLHWKSLESAYRSSPYFEYYENKLDKLINRTKHNFLVDLNMEIMAFIIDVLEIDLEVQYSREYLEMVDNSLDMRNSIDTAQINNEKYSVYTQVFAKGDFTGNLSIIDLICNEGPNAIHLLD